MDDKNGHKVYQLSPNYVKRTIAGQHVLVSIGEGLADFRGYIQLNESAAFLWDQLQEGKTKEELVRAFTEEYDVDEDAAGRDIDKSLDLLLTKELNGEVFHLPASFMAFVQSGEAVPELRFIVDSDFLSDPDRLIYRAENYMCNSFYRRMDGGLDWYRQSGDETPGIRLHVFDNWSTLVLSQNTATPRSYRKQMLNYECGCAFNYAMLAHEACVFHGVVMEYGGNGILVTARSGVGKTTHARMWRDYENALIINGDRALCRRIDGKWYAYGMPWCGSSGEYINRRVPVSCIVELRRGDTNRVETATPFDASMYLLERIFAPVWEPQLREKAVDYCQEIGTDIPVIRLFCRPDTESVRVLKQAILSLI